MVDAVREDVVVGIVRRVLALGGVDAACVDARRDALGKGNLRDLHRTAVDDYLEVDVRCAAGIPPRIDRGKSHLRDNLLVSAAQSGSTTGSVDAS